MRACPSFAEIGDVAQCLCLPQRAAQLLDRFERSLIARAARPPIGARRRRRTARPASDHAPRPRPGRWWCRRRLPGCWSARAPGRGCRPGTSCAGRGPRRTARRGRAWLRRSRRTSRTTGRCNRRTRARRVATRSRPSARPVAAKARWIDWRRASSRPDQAASRRVAGTAQLMWPPRATRHPPNATSATASTAPAVRSNTWPCCCQHTFRRRIAIQKIRPCWKPIAAISIPPNSPITTRLKRYDRQNPRSGSFGHPLAPIADALDEINGYCRRYHHAENPNAANEPIDDAELNTYVQTISAARRGGFFLGYARHFALVLRSAMAAIRTSKYRDDCPRRVGEFLWTSPAREQCGGGGQTD